MKYLPPALNELLEIPEFLRMMRTNPWLPDSLKFGNPWRLWVLRNDGTWAMREYPTYAETWKVALRAIRATDRFQDSCIVNKRRLVKPPTGLIRALRHSGFDGPWCPRCRRPTYFGAFTPRHHALKLQPVLTEDEPFRCYYCGIRKAATR